MRTRMLIGALVAVLIAALGVMPAHAAKPTPPSNVTITLDGDPSLPLADVARDWSKNTGVTVKVGPCSGPNCIHITVVDNPCSTGGVSFGMTGGCAMGSEDPGACKVLINRQLLPPNGWWSTLLYATKHEVGHCIYWFGGAGFIHLNSTRALMKAGFAGVPTAQDTSLTAEDRRFSLNLFD
jgi:hypothetical protein